MSASDSPVTAARRKRLQAWIDDNFAGVQADFIKKTGINQGELSSLLKPGGKSFGEKKAFTIEKQAGMPRGYLVTPDPASGGELGRAAPSANLAIEALENDVDVLQFALGAMLTVMARHRPAEAEELVAQLRRVPKKFHDNGLIPALEQALAGSRRTVRRRLSS